MYTLHLTHYLRFTVDGKSRSVKASETLELTEEDFEDGICDLNRFAYDEERLTVTEAKPISKDDFGESREGGARIVYAVSSGWKLIPAEDAGDKGTALRSVFTGSGLDDYKFVPAKVIRMHLNFKYSNTGGLAGSDAADPETVEIEPTESNGKYTVEWELPVKDGFRIVMDPAPLNAYLVNPPAGSETPEELEAALERGDFNVDVEHKTVYYYQEQSGVETNPTYNNRYSMEYNGAWNAARSITTTACTAAAVCGNADAGAHPAGVEDHGANALAAPKLKVTLTEDQLKSVMEGKDLDITVYYRRNATWYTVNHWVPKALAGTLTGNKEEKTENGITYVCLDQETIQGRVGAMTRAAAKTDGDTYEKLQSTGFSQKLIENTNTAVDIYYTAAESYRVIFDTSYTYIPRQQIKLGNNVDFTKVSKPKRTGYTFDGWQYLKKDATPNGSGEYKDTDYIDAGTKDNPALTVNEELIAAAKLQETGGVLALHLYPKWKPATTQVRVILWTEDLTGTDDVQATAQGGNTAYYNTKYDNYKNAPVTHSPQLGTSDPHYSNAGSFTVNVDTDSSLVESGNNKALLETIQKEVTDEFKTVMDQASGIDVAKFYKQAAFEIVHEEEDNINYNATTASADGKTMIYVYFTRNIYELMFTYYGNAAVGGNNSNYCVATNTNGYSFSNGAAVLGGNLNFGYSTGHGGGNGVTYNNVWMRANVESADQMPVPQTITIRAKYGADLRDVWPVARSEEQVSSLDSSGNRGNTARMISWGTTDGKYCEGGFFNSGLYNAGEPTIMGTYAAMSAEIVADPGNSGLRHNLVAYWFNGPISYYRNNHCFEVPDLNVTGMRRVSIYNNDTTDAMNFLYLVPTDNAAFAKYDFNDLMKVSYADGQIKYDDPDGTYYAVRSYNGKYYAVARQVDTVSSNAINKQNPSARLHMTRANTSADHSTQYTDSQGAYDGTTCGTGGNPYDLYFYYNRDRYTITYMVPSNNIATATEATLGTVILPYGAVVTKDKYGFELDYTDKNTNRKYGWTPAAEISVCPDRAENGTAQWKFKGWGLGPAGVNMQWTASDDTETQGQAGDAFTIEGNLRLYAIWDAPTYKVTFHLNGGTINNASASIEEDIPANTRYSANGIIPRPLRVGYTLEGWYAADENGNIIQPETSFDFDQTIAENKHAAAKWSAVSTETFDYTVYYVTDKPLDADKNKEKIQIDANGNIGTGGTAYYVLGKTEHRNQMFIANSSLNFSATVKNGYVPQKTNQILTMGKPDDTYNVIFHYDPITPGKHVVNFVEAGTESSVNPNLVKTLVVEADQTVVTPKSGAVRDLTEMGYELVSRNNDNTYTAAKGFSNETNTSDLTWIDKDGKTNPMITLAGEAIPEIITYLVQPITYTITYTNAVGSPIGADDALQAVTAAVSTSVANANGKNPTQYTTKDSFTVKAPVSVTVDGKQYQFSHWSLEENTTVKGEADSSNKSFDVLSVEPGTVGNLAFVANWKVATGALTVSKTVTGDKGEKDKAFHFTVTLSDTSVNGKFGDLTFTDGVAAFTLKHGDSKTALNLPAGITYQVSETEADQDGYTTTKTGDKGTITADKPATAAFTNTKGSTGPGPDPSRETGNLTVSKTVAGDGGETDKDFHFTVTLSDKTVSGVYGSINFTNGVAAFTLKHGESKAASGLPAGVTYTVTETEADRDGYKTTAVGANGTITKDVTAEAAFTNTRENAAPTDPDDPGKPGKPDKPTKPGKPEAPAGPNKPETPAADVPKTGDDTNPALWLILLGISCIGAVTASVVYRQRRKKEE